MSIYPIGTSEMLMYSTIQIKTNSGSGTGFFFHFKGADSQKIPVIITNKHVINHNKEEITFLKFHTGDNENKIVDEKIIKIEYYAKWYFHETQDLCFTFLEPIRKLIQKKYSKKIFYRDFNEDFIWSNEKLKNLEAVESILMVGYPLGLSDKINNFPLFRRGITANHPAVDFKKGIGVVDVAIFPGSSGSPIFIYEDSMYFDKVLNTSVAGGRLIFLGVLYGGPIYNIEGKIEVREIPTKKELFVNSDIMTNLGYYIKSKELMYFKELIFQMYPHLKIE